MSVARPLDPAHLAELEDERDFLLRSLDDLEREHAAGDVDDLDYAALRDDYTARAAAVLRSIEAGGPPSATSPPAKPRHRGVAIALGVVAFAVLAGVLVAGASGRRDEGGTASGDIRQSVTEKLNQAGRLGAEGRLDEAIELYDEVLEAEPANVEAMTYRGWLQALDGDTDAGLTSLIDAATAQPDYPDVHAFLAIVLYRNGLLDEAARELDRFEALDPPAAMRQLTDGLRDRIEEAEATADQPGGGT